METDMQTLQQLEQMRQIEEMKRQILGKILSKQAFERLGRVRSVNPQLAGQLDLYLLQIYQSGKMANVVISDDQLKEILKNLSEKKETTIRRV